MVKLRCPQLGAPAPTTPSLLSTVPHGRLLPTATPDAHGPGLGPDICLSCRFCPLTLDSAAPVSKATSKASACPRPSPGLPRPLGVGACGPEPRPRSRSCRTCLRRLGADMLEGGGSTRSPLPGSSPHAGRRQGAQGSGGRLAGSTEAQTFQKPGPLPHPPAPSRSPQVEAFLKILPEPLASAPGIEMGGGGGGAEAETSPRAGAQGPLSSAGSAV